MLHSSHDINLQNRYMYYEVRNSEKYTSLKTLNSVNKL